MKRSIRLLVELVRNDAIRWATFIFVLAIIVLLFGEPQPFSIIVGGAGGATGTFILLREIERRDVK